MESLDGLLGTVRLLEKPDVVLPDANIIAQLLQLIQQFITLEIDFHFSPGGLYHPLDAVPEPED